MPPVILLMFVRVFPAALLFTGIVVAAVALAAPRQAHAESMCRAPGHGTPGAGPPCAQGGPAISGQNEPTLNLGAGNPIHLITGNKHQRELDLPSHPGSPELQVARYYNSQDPRWSALGRGWALSYDTRLFFAGGAWQIIQADGSRLQFDASGGRPLPNAHGVLDQVDDGWRWSWPTGRTLWFDAKGLLTRIGLRPAELRLAEAQPAAGHFDRDVLIRRHPGPGPLADAILSVQQGTSDHLAFSYRVEDGAAYLDHIDTALGRFRYEYERVPPSFSQLRLSAVIRPDGIQRRYLYEPEHQAGNAFALTGIEIASANGAQRQRLNAWAYDAQGRAILSAHGPPEQGGSRLAVHYERHPTSTRNGLTTVTNAKGEQTRFESALKNGRPVLTAVDGAPCPGCAAPQTRAQYDAQGRLVAINGTRIWRNSAGAIRSLAPQGSGWPGLILNHQENGLRSGWSSSLTGREATHYNALGLPVRRLFSNGDSVDYEYDVHARPVRVREISASALRTRTPATPGTAQLAAAPHAIHETTLQWHGGLLARVVHPHEIEERQYDAHQRLATRNVRRIPPLDATAAARSPIHYRESFHYDAQHRLIAHHLPEGGVVHYRWRLGDRLIGIDWEDAQGRRRTVIETAPGSAGYRYGNGLDMITVLSPQRQVRLQALAYRGKPVWSASLDYDEGGRLARERHTVVAAGHDRSWSYAYDARDRLVGARRNGSAADVDTSWFAWNEDGSLAARHVNGATARPRIARDASGLPHMAEGFALSYGPNRRLVRVQEGDDVVAHYRHNAFGHRIAKRSRHGDVDYFYLDNRLVAERRNDAVLETAGPPHADTGNEPLQPLVTRRYLYAHHALVGVIDYVDGELYYAHSDPVGAPRVLTDATRTIRWLADYQPTGAAERVSGDLTLNLRLPGQVLDEETGWHDNVLRTYAPRLGHYLEPDPLGPVPGNQALGYADQQPRRHIDPLGLILFAFDGTRNNAQSQSNVWKMSQYYLDGPVYYHSGPGNPYYVDWNAITAWQASQIIDTQWLSLLNALSRADGGREHIPIDIIGFSRGAALARHFANLVGQHVDHGLFSYHDSVRGLVTACVDLRFMGLFDTVAQFGLAGSRNSNYDLSIASAWQWVAHAVALHERRWLFPLTSVQHGLSENTVEAPFIGAHADIGGGALMLDDGTMGSRGDLSDVALNWMIWQARAASLRFGDIAAHDAEISDPILHDLRSPALRSVQDGDRRVDGPGGTLMYGYQHDHPGLGSTQRQDVEALIARVENWRNSAGDEVGHVDMQAYALWLQRELGWAALPA